MPHVETELILNYWNDHVIPLVRQIQKKLVDMEDGTRERSVENLIDLQADRAALDVELREVDKKLQAAVVSARQGEE